MPKTSGKNPLRNYLRDFIENPEERQCVEKLPSLVKIERISENRKFDAIPDIKARRFTIELNSLNVAYKTKLDYIAVFAQKPS